MMALERHAKMPVLVFDHPTLGRCSAYPIGCSHEWFLLVSSPHRLQVSSSSVSQPCHTCSTPTLVYPAGICCPWYTSPGWVGMAVPYATVNIKFLTAVCRSQGVRWVISSTGNRCGAIASTAAWIPIVSTPMSVDNCFSAETDDRQRH